MFSRSVTSSWQQNTNCVDCKFFYKGWRFKKLFIRWCITLNSAVNDSSLIIINNRICHTIVDASCSCPELDIVLKQSLVQFKKESKVHLGQTTCNLLISFGTLSPILPIRCKFAAIIEQCTKSRFVAHRTCISLQIEPTRNFQPIESWIAVFSLTGQINEIRVIFVSFNSHLFESTGMAHPIHLFNTC